METIVDLKYNNIIYPDYQIDLNGNIFSKKSNRKLKIIYTKKYPAINLNKKYILVHRCMYNSFIGDIPEHHDIHHIDQNKQNCRLTNLQLVNKRAHYLYENKKKKKNWIYFVKIPFSAGFVKITNLIKFCRQFNLSPDSVKLKREELCFFFYKNFEFRTAYEETK